MKLISHPQTGRLPMPFWYIGYRHNCLCGAVMEIDLADDVKPIIESREDNRRSATIECPFCHKLSLIVE